MSKLSWRHGLMFGLVCAFAVQSYLVYSDSTGRAVGPMNAEAVAGKRAFHAQNCQTCHQIYGFGGLLGPDLTNVTSRLPLDAFRVILAVGPRQMPAFDLDAATVDAIYSYFRIMDETGVSVPRAPRPFTGLTDLKDIPWFEYPRNPRP